LEIGPIMTAAGAGGVFTWIGQSAVAFIKARSHRHAATLATDSATERHAISEANELDRHRDRLTFDLLQAAREEVAAARRDAADLRNLQARLHFFDEALDHLSALLLATEERDTSGKAERRARAFLLRMTKAGEYHGNISNGPDELL
jgi:hypothetical protein